MTSKGSLGRHVRTYGAILKSRLLGRRIPVITNILITNRCNLKCFYCYPDSFNRALEDMPLADFKRIIDLVHAKGSRVVVLLGGEPLIRKDVGEFIGYVRAKGMACEVVTNGFFVRQHLDALRSADSVCVSIDGDEDANDANRGKGSFRKAMEAIELLQANGIHTRIKAVITRNNLRSIDFLARLARERGMVLMAIIPTTYEDREYPEGVAQRWLTQEEYRTFVIKLIELKKAGYPIFHSYRALRYCRDWPYPYDAIVRERRLANGRKAIPCTAWEYGIFIDVDGRFFMSCLKTFDIQGKKILETDFDDWWIPQQRFGCTTCALLPNIEKSLVYNMHPGALWNMVRMALYRKPG
jgi:MoaA/NifB/PqqE/SkfB family radical SAM enzyme